MGRYSQPARVSPWAARRAREARAGALVSAACLLALSGLLAGAFYLDSLATIGV